MLIFANTLSVKRDVSLLQSNAVLHRTKIYNIWISSVASFLVLGGQDPEMYQQKIYVLILRERAKRASA